MDEILNRDTESVLLISTDCQRPDSCELRILLTIALTTSACATAEKLQLRGTDSPIPLSLVTRSWRLED